MLNCIGAFIFCEKPRVFFVRMDWHPCFSEQGTHVAMISAFLARFWSTLCGFCASPQKRPRTNGDVLLLRCPRTSRTYTNAVQFVSVLGPSGCEVLGVGPCTSGIQHFGRVCALPVFHFFAKIQIIRGLIFSKNRFFQSFLGPQKLVYYWRSVFGMGDFDAICDDFATSGVENNTTGILV